MCNINILKTKETNSKELINAMNLNGFSHNPHSEGYLIIESDGAYTIKKSTKKTVIRDDAHLYLCHQRFATQGAHTQEYAHPFETENLILVHNGVLSLFDATHSDTYIYAQKLQKAYMENDKNIFIALQKVHETLNGSFSIWVYEKNNGSLYYLKNESTEFFYASNINFFVGSTSHVNVEYALKYFNAVQEKIHFPQPHTIYKLIKNKLKNTGYGINVPKPKKHEPIIFEDDLKKYPDMYHPQMYFNGYEWTTTKKYDKYDYN